MQKIFLNLQLAFLGIILLIIISLILLILKKEGFRLPTEIEWEWFSKGGQVAIEQGTFNYEYSGSNNIGLKLNVILFYFNY